MIHKTLQQILIMLPVPLVIAGFFSPAQASPNPIFTPYLEQIRAQLAPGLQMRLPSEILSDILVGDQSRYLVKIAPSLITDGITVSIFNCHIESQACLVGSFSVNSQNSLGDRDDLIQHQKKGVPVTLNDKIPGYLLDGNKQNPVNQFSSVIWEQDGLIYRVRVKNTEDAIPIAASMSKDILIDTLATQTTTPVNKTRIVIQTPKNDPASTNTNNISQVKPLIPISSPIKVTIKPETPIKKVAIFPIRLIKITGNTVLQKDIEEVRQRFEGKDFPKADLGNQKQKIANEITNIYINKGYLTSKAEVVPEAKDNINRGVVDIKVTEGYLEEIQIEGTKKEPIKERIKSYIRKRIKFGPRYIFNTAKIEDQLRLLQQDPLFRNVTAAIQKSGKDGKSILVVTVKEAPSLTTNVSVDNYSPASIGSEKVDSSLGYRNIIKVGDQLVATYSTTFTRGSNIYDLSYQVPLNPTNGTLQFKGTFNLTQITQSPFDKLQIKGEKETYQVLYRQPLIRNSSKELALALGFSYDNGQTFTFDKPTAFGIGPDKNGVSRTSVILFNQEYTSRDQGGKWFLGSQFRIGTGLFNPTSNSSPIPDGYFFSWGGQIQRIQKLNNSNSLIMEASVQLTPDSLLPSEQFIIGGGQSVRGYRQNARSGDNGIRVSLEDRITLQHNKSGSSTLIAAPFIDLGDVWNVIGDPNKLPTQTFLLGPGLGLIWQPFSHLNLRFDYGFPAIKLDDRGNNIQDEGFYFRANYQY